MAGHPELRLSDDAAAALERGGVPELASVAAPGPMPSVPAASIRVSAATRQPSPVRSGRVGGRHSRMRMTTPPSTSAMGTA